MSSEQMHRSDRSNATVPLSIFVHLTLFSVLASITSASNVKPVEYPGFMRYAIPEKVVQWEPSPSNSRAYRLIMPQRQQEELLEVPYLGDESFQFQREGTKRQFKAPKMVCVPCILLPFLLAIYLKFIQPLVLKFIPASWKAKVDALLYPTATCPIKVPKQPTAEQSSQMPTEEVNNAGDCCDEAKKDI
ncbi:hypothetical protein DdX_00626 [Ditylenchus destructor]|uniref:Uncharacterized protein n=1 Tax=Ditylenchus destructor TaxID=166010 RepID=A0AAD4NK80_9BILA|nr:hypothetical protein DdX_00626 [Ditylenchus destructor]